MGPCLHDITRPQIADGVMAKIWKLAVNILNKRSRKPTSVLLPAWGLGGELTNPHLNPYPANVENSVTS